MGIATVWREFISFLLLIGVFTTLAGLLAPVFPPAEMANHFRPYIFLGCGFLLGAALLERTRRLARWSIGLVLFNAALLAIPALDAARGGVIASAQPSLKILSLNVWGRNTQLDRAARYILEQDADVVVLQEFPKRHAGRLSPRLRGAYPHIKVCDCRAMALLSKKPWIEHGSQASARGKPGLIWASFAGPGGQPYRVIGVHPSYPLRPWDQARDYEWLTRYLAGLGGPLVVAGDFNLTPWSWKLTRLTWSAGLERHGTLSRSWPGHGGFPAFLIDNVLTTPGFRSISFETGPYVGSDHRPIVARLALPNSGP